MSQLGERLRQAREQLGLSLAQASVETRIRQQALQALEEGRYDALPNDVVAKGFIRNYAHLLDLSPDELIDIYRIERGGTQPIRVVPTSTLPRTRSYVLPDFFGVFFVTIALVALTYVALSALGQIRDAGVVARVTSTATSQAPTPTRLATSTPEATTPQSAMSSSPMPTEPSGSSALSPAGAGLTSEPAVSTTLPASADTAQPGTATAGTPQPTPTLEAPIVVQISIAAGQGEGSWLRVQADGAIVYEQIMRPGEGQVFQAQRQIQIRAGNPTFVRVSVNGLPQEVLGQVPGEPVDWSWPPQ